MDFNFQPLELWRASNLAQGRDCTVYWHVRNDRPHLTHCVGTCAAETKAVIAAYERCLAANDGNGLANLRAAIEVSGCFHCRSALTATHAQLASCSNELRNSMLSTLRTWTTSAQFFSINSA